MITDELLYQRYHSGDESAANELVKRHADALTLYLYGCIQDFHEAEDLMIEAFSLMFAKKRPVSLDWNFPGFISTGLAETWCCVTKEKTEGY